MYIQSTGMYYKLILDTWYTCNVPSRTRAYLFCLNEEKTSSKTNPNIKT